MFLKQYYLGCLSHASYLLADEVTKTAIVVDPQRDVDEYIKDARQNGFRIRHVILTHLHADFISGHLELRDSVGAIIHIGATATTEYRSTPIHDGDIFERGNVRILFRETPGHTPESISAIVFDKQKSADSPYAVFTGDTLFIGDVGRPDLMASVGWTSEQLAGTMYDSLRQKLMTLPDETLVYPAHGAGSLCGKNLSKETVSTIGVQRKTNYALQPMTKEEFVKMLTADQPDAPNYFGYDAALNKQERQLLDEILEQTATPLDLNTAFALRENGAQILDTRNALYYAAGHIAGSINIGLDGQYATWAGTVLDRETPIVLVADPGEERTSVMRLGRIGFDNIAGYLKGGMAAGIPDALIEQTTHIDTEELATELATHKTTIIDVRGPGEWRSKRLERSINIPLNHLHERIREIPRDHTFIIHCQAGYRSSIAASILQREGIYNFKELVGGLGACREEKFKIVFS